MELHNIGLKTASCNVFVLHSVADNTLGAECLHYVNYHLNNLVKGILKSGQLPFLGIP